VKQLTVQAAVLLTTTTEIDRMPSTTDFNIAKVQQRIRAAEKKYLRAEHSVHLLAVTKTRPASVIRQAAAAGLSDFGENYLQEALDKQAQLDDLNLQWHFIGPIQSNKTRAIAEHFSWVHSVDRVKIAQRLNDQRPEHLPALNICLQLNISAEANKSGVSTADLASLATAVAAMPRLRLRGLMAIPRASDDPEEQQAAFALVKTAFIKLQQTHTDMDTLSMGMSKDMDAAIAEGSTMVRIGTDLFGVRA